MAKFNPFAKQKTETNEQISEEVELMSDDSVAYFEEKIQEKQDQKSQLVSVLHEKQQVLKDIGINLEAEKRKRQIKKEEINSKIESLKEKQREIAQKLALENGDSKVLEKQLHEISVEIVSEQAKVSVYEDDVKYYLPPNLKTDLKNRMNEYQHSIESYRNEKQDDSLLKEIREVIEELKNVEKSIFQFIQSTDRIEEVKTIIKPYIKYFISTEDIESLFTNDNLDLLENYFEVWINGDSEQDFAQYSRYLMRL